MINLLNFILLQRYPEPMPGLDEYNLPLLVIFFIVLIIVGLIKIVVHFVQEAFKTYTPEELEDLENTKLVFRNQAIRKKYDAELQP